MCNFLIEWFAEGIQSCRIYLIEQVCGLAQHTLGPSHWKVHSLHELCLCSTSHLEFHGLVSFGPGVCERIKTRAFICLGIGTSLAYLMSSPNILLRRKLWDRVPVMPRKAQPRSSGCMGRASAWGPPSAPPPCPPSSQLLSWAFW